MELPPNQRVEVAHSLIQRLALEPEVMLNTGLQQGGGHKGRVSSNFPHKASESDSQMAKGQGESTPNNCARVDYHSAHTALETTAHRASSTDESTVRRQGTVACAPGRFS